MVYQRAAVSRRVQAEWSKSLKAFRSTTHFSGRQDNSGVGGVVTASHERYKLLIREEAVEKKKFGRCLFMFERATNRQKNLTFVFLYNLLKILLSPFCWIQVAFEFDWKKLRIHYLQQCRRSIIKLPWVVEKKTKKHKLGIMVLVC